MALYGGPGSGPAGPSGVWSGKLRSFLASRCVAWQGKVLPGFAEQGAVSFGDSRCCADFRGKVSHGLALRSRDKVLLWSGEALLGVAGFIGALYCEVRIHLDADEAPHGIVMFCPARYCIVGLGVFWKGGAPCGFVLRGSAGRCFARFAEALLRFGTAGSRFVRLGAAGQAPAFTGTEV